MAENSANEAVRTALQNELVLQEIFRFLPLKSLLSASLINKFWNSEVRTYLHDHRKCTARISSGLPCKQLEELDHDLAQMTIIPFNSLNISPGADTRIITLPDFLHQHHAHEDFNNYDGSFENLFSKLKLKYFQDAFADPVTSFICRLLTEKSYELRSLTFERISAPLVTKLCAKDQLEFPCLRELKIMEPLNNPYFDDRGLLRKILDGAPVLEKITHSGSNRLFEMIPKSKYRLVTTFGFGDFEGEEQMELTRKFVASEPGLSELWDHFIVRNGVPGRCHSLFQSLLQSSRISLQKLEISGACSMHEIQQSPPLPNLTQLIIVYEFLPDFQSMQLQPKFPKLKVVHLHLCNAGFNIMSPEDVDSEFNSFDPDSPNSSKTVKNLSINMEVCSGGLVQLMKTFPNLEHSEISPLGNTPHALPYNDIFRFWPNLYTLVISSPVPLDHPLPNCDAQFCGINQEEVELLWDMEDEYLQKLQIVPVRPCVSTMKNLESLSISFWFENSPVPDDDEFHPRIFLVSPVTEFLVSQRMPWLHFSLKLRKSRLFPFNLMS